MAKSIIYNDEARRALEKGIDLLAEAVAVTLGPKGRNVVLEKKFGAPQIVNDGVTIEPPQLFWLMPLLKKVCET